MKQKWELAWFLVACDVLLFSTLMDFPIVCGGSKGKALSPAPKVISSTLTEPTVPSISPLPSLLPSPPLFSTVPMIPNVSPPISRLHMPPVPIAPTIPNVSPSSLPLISPSLVPIVSEIPNVSPPSLPQFSPSLVPMVSEIPNVSHSSLLPSPPPTPITSTISNVSPSSLLPPSPSLLPMTPITSNISPPLLHPPSPLLPIPAKILNSSPPQLSLFSPPPASTASTAPNFSPSSLLPHSPLLPIPVTKPNLSHPPLPLLNPPLALTTSTPPKVSPPLLPLPSPPVTIAPTVHNVSTPFLPHNPSHFLKQPPVQNISTPPLLSSPPPVLIVPPLHNISAPLFPSPPLAHIAPTIENIPSLVPPSFPLGRSPSQQDRSSSAPIDRHPRRTLDSPPARPKNSIPTQSSPSHSPSLAPDASTSAGTASHLSHNHHSPVRGSVPVSSPKPPKSLTYSPLGSHTRFPNRSKLLHSSSAAPNSHHHQSRNTSSISPSNDKVPLQPPIASPYGFLHMGPRASILPPSQTSEPKQSFIPSPSPMPQTKQSLPPSLAPLPQSKHVLPPPPPDMDCTSLVCTDPLTNTPSGSPCECVHPMKVGLRLKVALYTFFPLVSELALEIASGTFLKQNQVRIMGANAATEQPNMSIVLVDLVPLGHKFDGAAAYMIAEIFWYKKVGINATSFGDYDVLYVMYPGLPPSPPVPPEGFNVVGGSSGNENNSSRHPLGVNVNTKKEKLGGSLIAIIVLSSIIALVLSVGSAWFLFLKPKDGAHSFANTPRTPLPLFSKALCGRQRAFGSFPSSPSGSFTSSMAMYTGSAKTFTAAEIERATNKFEESKMIGEGGFGRVYQGILDDETKVAVKVLKRDDHQGSREFLAEVEMLGRLHHRNLVKLIGICTEENSRCLVYELIPNGSVDSHLHGIHKEIAPLDWGARMKIALGSARGLAYLHEDSSPRVIHRDFKASNILLEYDFVPKVSDFGLARTAVDGGSGHISTRVMGTFGYVAPEYAMTGHLLVKSDVYSYGVVLLEILTGRKPVDMFRPHGQENLVTWARPLLTNREGLDMILDPALGTSVPFESVAKVAAIASLCVQPEVSHRPFMGEVVQALKLVCNESDGDQASESCSQGDAIDQDSEIRIDTIGLVPEADIRVVSASEIFGTSSGIMAMDASGSFRRHSSSGPLNSSNSRGGQFWQRIKGGFSRGSMSD